MVHEKLWKTPVSWCNESPYVALFCGGKPIDFGMKWRRQSGLRWDIMPSTSMLLNAATTASAVILR